MNNENKNPNVEEELKSSHKKLLRMNKRLPKHQKHRKMPLQKKRN